MTDYAEPLLKIKAATKRLDADLPANRALEVRAQAIKIVDAATQLIAYAEEIHKPEKQAA